MYIPGMGSVTVTAVHKCSGSCLQECDRKAVGEKIQGSTALFGGLVCSRCLRDTGIAEVLQRTEAHYGSMWLSGMEQVGHAFAYSCAYMSGAGCREAVVMRIRHADCNL
jgi:hypothetical protein